MLHTTVGEFNTERAMPLGVLYVPLSLGNVPDKRPYQYAVKENIRSCRHYIQVLDAPCSDQPPQAIWGPPERHFATDLRLALECCVDPALPMREVAVLLKRPTQPMADLDGVPAVIEFSDIADFKRHLIELLSRWLATVTVS